ncbi:MAG TPA: hypothetical protein VK912_18495 [Longimicrobiales bacterium]|nr:hypothetical protein [Longimicrobiales bacterium]
MTREDHPVRVAGGMRSRAARWLAPGLVTILMTLAVGWLARAPYQPPGAEDGLLRLSWRMRAPDTETCRVRTQAELDALPVHMRTPEVCESHSAAWELVVQVDSQNADTTRILQGGARRDRPLFVLRELPLEPGAHHVRIGFTPEEGLRENGTAVPLVFDSVLWIAPGEVALVTLERERGTFIVRRSIQATKGMTE